jgi:twitching motility protein PilU
VRLKAYFQLMHEREASDLYVTANAQVKLRVEGRIVSVGRDPVPAKEIELAATSLMNEYQLDRLREQQQVEFGIEDPDYGRFRFNAFRQRSMLALAVRYIPAAIPPLDTLNLPPVLGELAMLPRGLILVVGATGAGKSTTLAAMIDRRNRQRADHILTIEDPIEYVHSHRISIVNQRELVTDTPSYPTALRSALRAKPDVVMIGEIRDRETIDATIELANTGHLVLSTLHTTNAPQTLDRVLNMFPDIMRRQVLMDLGANLRAVISQRLVHATDGKLLPAAEVMLNTPFIADLIRQGRLNEIRAAMDDSREAGMQTYDEALAGLYQAEKITLEEALANADSRANLEARIHFG